MKEEKGKNGLRKASSDALLTEAEPWESWETKLVIGSIGIAVAGLIILGWVINNTILTH